MEGTNIGKAPSRTNNGKRCSGLSSVEKETGRVLGWVLLFLPFGIEIVEYGLAGINFVNHVVKCAHYDVRVHPAVVGHKGTNLIQPRVIVIGVIISGQHKLTKPFKLLVVHDVADVIIDC